MENLIGKELALAISHLNKEKLTELRFRVGKNLQMEYGGEILDVTSPLGKEILIDSSDIKEVVLNFSGGSFFSKEVQIREGFLTKNGARLGVCGNCDYISGEISAISDITALALRLPFSGEIKPSKVAKDIAKNLQSTLIIAPFGAGKTTFLKEILLSFPSNKKVFLCDERGEFEGMENSLSNIDCMRFAKKNKAFEIAIRLFSPHAIMIDEMFYSLDSKLLEKARMAGIAIYASFHGRNVSDYQNSELYKSGIFQKYVVLSERMGKCTIEEVIGEKGARI